MTKIERSFIAVWYMIYRNKSNVYLWISCVSFLILVLNTKYHHLNTIYISRLYEQMSLMFILFFFSISTWVLTQSSISYLSFIFFFQLHYHKIFVILNSTWKFQNSNKIKCMWGLTKNKFIIKIFCKKYQFRTF